MKKDILLLHGAVGSSSQFHSLAEELLDTFNVHSPDLPGHGGSMMPDRFSISVFAEFVEQYCVSRGMAFASLKLLKAMMGSIGPNISSPITAASGGTSSIKVGPMNFPAASVIPP